MKKNSYKPLIARTVIVVITFTFMALSYEYSKTECKTAVNDKEKLSDTLKFQTNSIRGLQIEYDKLTTSERIIPLAESTLSLRRNDIEQVILIDKERSEKIKEVEEKIKEKYD